MRIPTLLLLAMLPAPLAAQHLSLAPEIGFYVPTEKLTKLTSASDFSEIEAGPSFGARIGLWFGKRIGVEASGAYVPSTFKLSSSSNTITKQDAKLYLGSGQLVVFLLPRTGLLTVFLDGGVGMIRRSGAAYADATDKTDVSGVFGAGAGIRLGPLAVTGGAELFNYSSASSSTTTGESQRQRDIRFKLGFGIPFGH
jgi:hypothetical protein